MIDYQKNTIQSIIIGAIIGCLCYFILFGIKTIIPANIEWYVNLLGDSGQHIIGWLAYIKSQYFFPVGLTDYLLYPDKVSIVYSDSLPLLSFLLKPIALICGAFQYFGLYGLLNFILQGIFAAFIIGRWTNNKIIIAIFTVMIVLSPIMINRMYGHHALSSQWLILMSIAYILQNHDAPINVKKDMIFWSVLFFIIPGIHFYFFPMVYGLAFMYSVYKYNKNIKMLIVQLILYIIVTLIAMYIYGGFYNLNNPKGTGIGYYAANLNTFINSAHIGSILPGMKIVNGQYEGIGYLGFGFILMVFIAIGIVIYKKIKKQNILIEKKKFYFILATFIIYFFVATGGSVYFNEYKIFYIDLSGVLSTFRSSGRFIWVCVYIIEFVLIYIIIKNIKNNRIIIPMLLIILCVQIADIYSYLQRKSVAINQSFKNESIMVFNENECKYLNDNYEYVHLNVKSYNDYNIMYPYIYSFLRCGIPVNNFYLARVANHKRNETITKQLENGKLDNILLLSTKNNKLNIKDEYAKDVYINNLGNAFLISNNSIPFLNTIPTSIVSKKCIKKVSVSEDSFFIKGWYRAEKTLRWSSANKSQIVIPVGNKTNSALISLKLRPYLNEKVKEQEISISVNNKKLLSSKMDKNYAFYEIIVPKTLIVDNKIILDIELSNKISSPSAVGRNDGRLLGAAVSNIEYYE